MKRWGPALVLVILVALGGSITSCTGQDPNKQVVDKGEGISVVRVNVDGRPLVCALSQVYAGEAISCDWEAWNAG